MAEKIRVAVAGCKGRMGSAAAASVSAADDMDLVCGIDPIAAEGATFDDSVKVFKSVQDALAEEGFDVLIDFTRPDAVAENVMEALRAGVSCVVGTTGLTQSDLQSIYDESGTQAALFYAPNFTTGAVLMMQFAKAAAPYFPDAEVIEFHHARKLDAPSGTAMQTAAMISAARDGASSEAPGSETEREDAKGARGALVDGVPVHSVRSNGYVASQEVIFGSAGQTLSIRHDSWDRESYMPGVLLGVRAVASGEAEGLVVGLENLM